MRQIIFRLPSFRDFVRASIKTQGVGSWPHYIRDYRVQPDTPATCLRRTLSWPL